MPFALPTIPFTPAPALFGTGFVARRSATVGALARLDASIAAVVPAGRCATLTSLGFNAGTAPARSTSLSVFASATSFENGLVFAAVGHAASFSGIQVFVEEFSSGGGFLRGVPGPMTVVFDASATVIGLSARFRETRTRSASFVFPAVPGRFYRVWVDSVQTVVAGGAPAVSAVSNFTFDFTPVFFVFS
jgi:hypothetical protein